MRSLVTRERAEVSRGKQGGLVGVIDYLDGEKAVIATNVRFVPFVMALLCFAFCLLRVNICLRLSFFRFCLCSFFSGFSFFADHVSEMTCGPLKRPCEL